jgi:hypothetical protein
MRFRNAALPWNGVLLSLIAFLFLAQTTLYAQPSKPNDDSPAGENSTTTKTSPSKGSFVEILSQAQNGTKSTLQGELVTHHPSLGHLILNADGELKVVSPDEFVSLETLESTLVPTPPKELGEKLLKDMPAGSKYFVTENYVVCYNTTETYARWNAGLYEQRLKGFLKFWGSKGLKLQKPRFPLIALIFESKDDYVAYASNDFAGSEGTYGYYHQARNRLASYDLTGVEGVLPPGVKVNRDALLNTIQSRPEAERTMATIFHEATHQMAFNCGLQTRLGDNPLWLSEGIATYFEVPKGIGKLNTYNYMNLANSLSTRPPDSLPQLLTDDSLLRKSGTMTRGYAESWGLFHFLVQSNPKGMVKYLEIIRATPIGFQSNAKERLDLFRSCFDEDLEKIDSDFLKHIKKIR